MDRLALARGYDRLHELGVNGQDASRRLRGHRRAGRFDGDASLRRRPMEPVAAQLRAFGARIETAEGHLPLELRGDRPLRRATSYSFRRRRRAKSALLFAPLLWVSRSASRETAVARSHGTAARLPRRRY